MENASKALIIAGAILLAILIISLGIMILGKAQDTINGSGMTQTEVQAFNERFTKYEGKQKGSSVRTLIQEVIASNGTEENQDAKRLIKVESGKGSSLGVSVDGTEVKGTANIKSTVLYTVSFAYATDGRVTKITIESPSQQSQQSQQ